MGKIYHWYQKHLKRFLPRSVQSRVFNALGRITDVHAQIADTVYTDVRRDPRGDHLAIKPIFLELPKTYHLKPQSLVSIIIPFKDQVELLRRCVESIEQKTDYPSYEIILVDNGSREAATREYLRNCRHQVLSCDIPYNFHTLNNRGAAAARGDYFLFLNSDTEVINREWLTSLLWWARQPQVGIVGAKLLYPNQTIQHAGLVLTYPHGIAESWHRFLQADHPGYLGSLQKPRRVSAVTGACLFISRELFERLGGFDEAYGVGYGDVDLCLKAQKLGSSVVFNPDARLYHHEMITRLATHKTAYIQHPEDSKLFISRWREVLEKGDPYLDYSTKIRLVEKKR